jgi:hypothetical protein
MNDILFAFYMTIELWVFLGILVLALVAEELVNQKSRKRLTER